MTLDKLIRNDWVEPHATSPEEIAKLLGVADRNLKDCKADISADMRLYAAHGAVIALAKAALAACGYRAKRESNHYILFQSLEDTIGADRDTTDNLDAFRKKRNTTEYDMAGAISGKEADEIVEIASGLRNKVEQWLRSNHPDLLP